MGLARRNEDLRTGARVPPSADTSKMRPVGSPIRVLVVDDEPRLVWMLRFGLEAEGYEIFAAGDGVSALEAVRAHHPTLMLLDVMMPVMDGWAVMENLRSLPEGDRPRVVVLSALSSLADRARATELGAEAFLTKPFNVDDVLGVLRQLEPAP